MMKALVLESVNEFPKLRECYAPLGSETMAVVDIHAASLNRRDVWITKGQYPGVKFPLILGSDGAGVWEGKEVVLQPGSQWGGDERFQGKAYQILGLPANGCFAEKVAVDPAQVYPKPLHLSMEEAAALPLAGLTAYRVLFKRCKASAGEKILITGAGGGVALFCIQFALKAGMEVYVTSGADWKLDKAIALGAAGGANYKANDWPEFLKKQAGGFDVIIDGAGGADFNSLVKLCHPGGRIGIYGGTLGAVPNFSPQPIFWKQISILGSTMGSDQDFQAMLDFVNLHRLVPIVDSVFSLSEGPQAFQRMEKNEQFGKLVLRLK